MTMYGSLREEYPLTDVAAATSTKERILLESTILFARRGVAAVSMRDIAEKTGLRVASLYNHFASKDDLWLAVLAHVKELYLAYFNRLSEAIQEADTFKEMLDCMFLELYEIVSIFTYYGFSLVITEQFTDERAYKIYNEIFLGYSINFIQKYFDDYVANGKCRPFDTAVTATNFMHAVLISIMQRANQDMGRTPFFDDDIVLKNFHDHIYFLATGEYYY